mmetsp:Transcript_22665/g.39112  ORF Transcript_22665/g.39112 Transcript_22665/m.39112 type:complete len:317 (+) Transcript_22665:297-1247(+)|eukprot:CAMPEP_0184692654 /NCGR_PEP_ID=MMETSP0313-20130426/1040_1 /TAXON_ID=2792 /ORGANISM="Porphyridium aerugineum, Strain SAG 1380-2" /LENGTH=316 /DNA_ID=CAMNT_0027150497 /DNA_START=246 /DNA_END=1196 /DNA_ORIENTATION=-
MESYEPGSMAHMVWLDSDPAHGSNVLASAKKVHISYSDTENINAVMQGKNNNSSIMATPVTNKKRALGNITNSVNRNKPSISGLGKQGELPSARKALDMSSSKNYHGIGLSSAMKPSASKGDHAPSILPEKLFQVPSSSVSIYVDEPIQQQQESTFSAKEQSAPSFKGITSNYWMPMDAHGNVADVEYMALPDSEVTEATLFEPPVIVLDMQDDEEDTGMNHMSRLAYSPEPVPEIRISFDLDFNDIALGISHRDAYKNRTRNSQSSKYATSMPMPIPTSTPVRPSANKLVNSKMPRAPLSSNKSSMKMVDNVFIL